MSQAIIYNQDNGVVAVVWPSPLAVEKYGIDVVAKKDVPNGKPYKIIPAADVPIDRTFRDAWVVDDADLTDGIGVGAQTFEELLK